MFGGYRELFAALWKTLYRNLGIQENSCNYNQKNEQVWDRVTLGCPYWAGHKVNIKECLLATCRSGVFVWLSSF